MMSLSVVVGHQRFGGPSSGQSEDGSSTILRNVDVLRCLSAKDLDFNLHHPE